MAAQGTPRSVRARATVRDGGGGLAVGVDRGVLDRRVGDPSAAGSSFGMLVCLALGMAGRACGRARAGWMALAVTNAVGLWFSESRTAIAAAAIAAALAAAWVRSGHWTRRARIAALGMVLVVGIGASFGRAKLLERDPTFRGGGFRQQFNATSFRMIAARPLSGVGIGQDYQRSY